MRSFRLLHLLKNALALYAFFALALAQGAVAQICEIKLSPPEDITKPDVREFLFPPSNETRVITFEMNAFDLPDEIAIFVQGDELVDRIWFGGACTNPQQDGETSGTCIQGPIEWKGGAGITPHWEKASDGCVGCLHGELHIAPGVCRVRLEFLAGNPISDWKTSIFHPCNFSLNRSLVSPLSNSPVCFDEEIRLRANPVAGLVNPNYHWSGPSGFSSQDENPIIENAKPQNSGIYKLRVQSAAAACYDEQSTKVYVGKPIDVSETHTDAQGCIDGSIELKAEGGFPPYQYYLNNQVSTSATNKVPPGEYSVRVSDSLFCESEELKIKIGRQTVAQIGTAEMPNAFSPNGDGLNDTFGVVASPGAHVEVLAFRIFDRWGNQIMINPQEPVWTGTIKGKDAPSDVYIYTMQYRIDGCEIKTVKGNVTLLR